MMYSGIDLHKRTLAIHTLDDAGRVVRKANMPTHREAITAYFATLPGPHQAVVECTGMWYWLRDLLVPQGIDLHLGHAKYLKAISYAKVKTDAIDAETLAQLLRVQLIPEAHMISDTHREMRDLLRARLLLVSRSIRCQRSVGALMEKYNVATPEELLELPRLQRRPPHGATGVAQDPCAPAGERATGARACDPGGAAARVGARHRANGGVHPAARDR